MDSVMHKKSCRTKVREMARTMSPKGILEVRHMTLGIGSILGNVEDRINVRSTYKITKNLAAVATLHGEICT